MDELTKRIQEIVQDAEGTWGISLQDIDFEKSWHLNGEESFYAASVIKLPIMATVFLLAEQKSFHLSDRLVLRREDIVGGMGVLQHLSPGIKLSIYDLITLMIIQSDNTATNMLIDLVSTEKIQAVLTELEMKNSNFYHKMMTVPVNVPRNSLTPLDVTKMLQKFINGKYISLHVCEQMIEIMKKQQIRTSLPALISEDNKQYVGSMKTWEIASKTGRGHEIHHDAGVFYVGNRTMIVTVLSKGCDFINGPLTIAKIGKEVYTYLKNI